MKVDVELEPFTPLLRPTYADAHAGAISEVRMEGYEFGHTYVWQGPGVRTLTGLSGHVRTSTGLSGRCPGCLGGIRTIRTATGLFGFV